jgi:hypothetical protein
MENSNNSNNSNNNEEGYYNEKYPLSREQYSYIENMGDIIKPECMEYL